MFFLLRFRMNDSTINAIITNFEKKEKKKKEKRKKKEKY